VILLTKVLRRKYW